MVRKARSAPRKPRAPRKAKPASQSIARVEVQELESMRGELERARPSARRRAGMPIPRTCGARSAKLVLTLVEFISQLLERQAMRRSTQGR